jgi:hypothetical protein
VCSIRPGGGLRTQAATTSTIPEEFHHATVFLRDRIGIRRPPISANRCPPRDFSGDIVFKVRPPTADEVGLMHEGQTLIGFIWPAQNPELMQQLAERKVTVLAIDCLPRTLSAAPRRWTR